MNYVDLPGLRPLRHLLIDPQISEIMVNGTRVFVERMGTMQAVGPIFATPHQVDAVAESLVSLTSRAVTSLSPFVDFRLPDGSRVHIAVRPVALDGPIITIRRPTRELKGLDDLVKRGALSTTMAHFLVGAVAARLNILFAGGTGSGKTTLLGLLAAYIPESERIVVIEDTAELDIRQPNTVRLECRAPNLEGTGAMSLSELLRNSLRMRPTRILLGEVRGDEAFDLLAAMSSGHDGGFAVLHASSPEQAVARLAMMVLARGLPYPLWAIQRQIAAAVDLVVQHAQLPDGSRRVTHITALDGLDDDDQIILRDLFTFDQLATTDGRIEGRFLCTGHKPGWMPRLRHAIGPTADALLEKEIPPPPPPPPSSQSRPPPPPSRR